MPSEMAHDTVASHPKTPTGLLEIAMPYVSSTQSIVEKSPHCSKMPSSLGKETLHVGSISVGYCMHAKTFMQEM